MESTLQSHKKMLRRACTVGRLGGLVMMAMGGFGLGVLAIQGNALLGLIGARGLAREGMDSVESILTGLVVLIGAELIRFAINEMVEPKWILRNGHIILSMFALFLLATYGVRDIPQMFASIKTFLDLPANNVITFHNAIAVGGLSLLGFMPSLVKVLAVLGLAVILRTVLPVMAESKTLA